MSTSVTRVIRPIIPKVELIGDWGRVKHVIQGLDEAITIGTEKGQKAAAERIYRIVRRHIRENGAGLGWEPLSPRYLTWKTKQGYSPTRLLFLSGTYYNNIKVWNNNGRYYVGVDKKVYNTKLKRNITVGMVANILERGSKATSGKGSGIKARRLWAPSFKEFGGTKKIKSLIIWHIRAEIRNRLGIKVHVK